MFNFLKIPYNPTRNIGLDWLRALAILFTLIGHGVYCFSGTQAGIINLFVFDGVAIFFVLSGFLIMNLFYKEIVQQDELNISHILKFMGKRWFRTLPNYFFILLILYIIYTSFLPHKIVHIPIWKYLFFLQTANQEPLQFFGESWSIAIEEWFYLIFPILYFILSKIYTNSRNNLLFIIVLFILYSMGYRIQNTINLTGYNPSELAHINKYTLFARFDGLGFGMLTAWIYNYRRDIFNKLASSKIWVIGAIIMWILLKIIHKLDIAEQTFSILDSTIKSISLALAIPFLYIHFKGTMLLNLNKNVQKIAILSYSIYLINLSLVYILMVKPYLNNKTTLIFQMIAFISFICITIILSLFSYHFVEKPFLNMRNKLLK